jgi:hypothetical protein
VHIPLVISLSKYPAGCTMLHPTSLWVDCKEAARRPAPDTHGVGGIESAGQSPRCWTRRAADRLSFQAAEHMNTPCRSSMPGGSRASISLHLYGVFRAASRRKVGRIARRLGVAYQRSWTGRPAETARKRAASTPTLRLGVCGGRVHTARRGSLVGCNGCRDSASVTVPGLARW